MFYFINYYYIIKLFNIKIKINNNLKLSLFNEIEFMSLFLLNIDSFKFFVNSGL